MSKPRMNEPLHAYRRRMFEARQAEQAEREAATKAAELSMYSTRAEIEAQIARLKREIEALSTAWEEFYQLYPDAYANDKFHDRIVKDQDAIGELMIRLAMHDYRTAGSRLGGDR